MIELKSVSKVFQTKDIETRALDDICLKINSSEFVSIMGPSGCGKSTLLNLIGSEQESWICFSEFPFGPLPECYG